MLLLLALTACNRSAKESSGVLDAVLSTGAVNRVVIVENYADTTNEIPRQQVPNILAALQPTNRISYTFWHKSYVSADLFLYHDDIVRLRLAFFPRECVLYYMDYDFTLRDRRVITNIFLPPLPNSR